MKYRTGKVKGKKYANAYYGRECLSQQEWDVWCEKSKSEFLELWNKWVKSGWDRNNAPSIDRIDNSRGYITGNLQWVTNRENISKYIKEKWGENNSHFNK